MNNIDIFTSEDYENINLDYPDGYLEELLKIKEQENKQLKDNWNKLKEYLKEIVDSDCYCPYDGYDWQDILDKMQELESGNSNE